MHRIDANKHTEVYVYCITTELQSPKSHNPE